MIKSLKLVFTECFGFFIGKEKRQPPNYKKCVLIFVKDKMQMMETTQLILLYFTSYITKITIVALILVHILLIIAKAAMRCAFVHSTLFYAILACIANQMISNLAFFHQSLHGYLSSLNI